METAPQPPCGAPAFPVILEAERAELTGVVREDEHAGYQGDGYVAQFDQIRDAVSFDLPRLHRPGRVGSDSQL